MSIAENISHPLISALGWTVLHSLWQILAIAVLWRLALYLARKSPSHVKYTISLLALLAIPLTFAGTFIRQWGIYSGARRLVSLQFDDAVWYAGGGQGGDFFLVNKTYPAFLEGFEAWMPAVFWLYVGGLLLFSLHGIFSYYKIYNLRTTQVSPLPQMWQSRIRNLAKRSGVKGRIPVLLSKRVSVPVVIGFLKPVILLPLAMLAALSPEQVEAILLHELRHIRNKDHYINIIQNFLEILFFFHPVTWIISRHLRNERENRIDEWVVSKTGAPLIYAQALVSLESKRSGTLQPVLAATQSKNHLLSRIKNIMTMKTRSFKPGKNLAALAVILAATLSLAWFDPTKSMNNYAFQDYADRVHYTGEPVLRGMQDTAPAATPSISTTETTSVTNAPSGSAATRSSAADVQPQSDPDKKSGKVVLSDGSSVRWDELSEKDRQQIQLAMEEARLAMEQVNRELMEKFNSEEFRLQMAQVQEEVRRAMEEVNRELNSEEFRREMQKAGEEVRRALKEMEQMDWEGFNENLRITLEEVGKGLEQIGPGIHEIMQEIMKSLDAFSHEKEKGERSE